MKKRRLLSILLTLCMVLMLCPVAAFAETPLIKIDGPDEICAEQDYDFTVIVSDEVTPQDFVYSCGENGGTDAWGLDDRDGNKYYGTVPASAYGNANSIELRVQYRSSSLHGESHISKTVSISRDHIFKDGICGCGEKKTYTIEYSGGDDPGCADVKTHGENLTLRGETFTKDGYIQTGWVDKEHKREYSLGETYTEDADVTLYPIWDEIVTLEVPFTIKVKQEGNIKPGKTTFDLAIVDANADKESYKDITVTGSVTTNGAGDYKANMTITGPSQQLLRDVLSNGMFVQQVNTGEPYWKYDDTVWYLYPSVVAMSSTDDAVSGDFISIYPTGYEESDDGSRYYYKDQDANSVTQMSFINRYTESSADPSNPEGTTNGDSDKNSKADAEDSAKTGDDANLALWLALMLLSGAGITGTAVYTRRKRTNE